MSITKTDLAFAGGVITAGIAAIWMIDRSAQADLNRRLNPPDPEDRTAEKWTMANARNRVNESAYNLRRRQPRILKDWEFDANGL